MFMSFVLWCFMLFAFFSNYGGDFQKHTAPPKSWLALDQQEPAPLHYVSICVRDSLKRSKVVVQGLTEIFWGPLKNKATSQYVQRNIVPKKITCLQSFTHSPFEAQCSHISMPSWFHAFTLNRCVGTLMSSWFNCIYMYMLPCGFLWERWGVKDFVVFFVADEEKLVLSLCCWFACLHGFAFSFCSDCRILNFRRSTFATHVPTLSFDF